MVATKTLRFIRLPEVLQMTGLCKSSVYAFVRDGGFPRPVPIGGRAVAWVESDIQAWIEQRIQLAQAQAA